MTTKAQARARDKYNGKTKRFSLRFREDELALYDRLSREDAPGALIKELLEKHFREAADTTMYMAWGEGDAGDGTIYGFGRSRQEALADSVQYGYDPDRDYPHLFTDEISYAAFRYIKKQRGNDIHDDLYAWNGHILKLKSEA